jgi:hypothetical protein
MTKITKTLGYINLFFVFYSLAMGIYSLTESPINYYKTGFWLMVLIANVGAFIQYLDNRD